VVHHGEALARESGDPSLAEAVASGRFEGLDGRLQALLAYATTLTRSPSEVAESDAEALRAAGLDDRAIVDANQVVAYFNYVNRIADGLGVELEPDWPADVRAPRSYALGSPLPVVDGDALPWLTVSQMRDVDRVMVDELAVPLERMAENAGRGLAELVRRTLGGDVSGRRVLVLAGTGGNGAGGLVAARLLLAAGAQVAVRLGAEPERLAPVPRAQHDSLLRLGVDAGYRPGEPLPEADLILDALLGYGQTGAPRGEAAGLIELTAGRRMLALDVPSGLELENGTLHDPHVRAEATLTLALPKEGLRSSGAGGAVGRLFLGDVSVPPSVYDRLGVPYRSPFGRGPLVRIA
jgi:NAD(P)H-hydrate epimerase